jgi:hypothetical protein
MEFENLNQKYMDACRKEIKNDLNKIINNFIDDENLDKDYKDNIIHLIVGLLTLK